MIEYDNGSNDRPRFKDGTIEDGTQDINGADIIFITGDSEDHNNDKYIEHNGALYRRIFFVWEMNKKFCEISF